jgi:hypothetical protein
VRAPAGVGILEPPPDLDSLFLSAGVYHGVELRFEFNPQTDVPPGAAGSVDYATAVIPVVDRDREIYRACNGLHEIVFSGGAFEVGGFRYPAERGTVLHVFKSREGALRFRYRGQEIILESRKRWIPAISIHEEREYEKVEAQEGTLALRGRAKRKPLGQVQRVRETLRAARLRIDVDSESPTWLVDGSPHRPDPERPLRVVGAAEFNG